MCARPLERRARAVPTALLPVGPREQDRSRVVVRECENVGLELDLRLAKLGGPGVRRKRRVVVVPRVALENKLPPPIDLFGMYEGHCPIAYGTPGHPSNATDQPCDWIGCGGVDACHPDDVGYGEIAKAVRGVLSMERAMDVQQPLGRALVRRRKRCLALLGSARQPRRSAVLVVTDHDRRVPERARKAHGPRIRVARCHERGRRRSTREQQRRAALQLQHPRPHVAAEEEAAADGDRDGASPRTFEEEGELPSFVATGIWAGSTRSRAAAIWDLREPDRR